MSSEEYKAERSRRLGFAKAVIKNIEPVLLPFSFSRINEDTYVVEYEAPRVSLAAVHDYLSFGIGVELVQKEAPAIETTLGEILTAEGVPRISCFFQASTPQRVEAMTVVIADMLLKHGAGALAGDRAVYRKAIDVSNAVNLAYNKKMAQGPVREAAEKAWHRRDYAKVRELYESIAADLTVVERKRLSYAGSHAD